MTVLKTNIGRKPLTNNRPYPTVANRNHATECAARVSLTMTQLSRRRDLQTLWQSGDLILSRSTLADEETSVLVLAPASERPTPAIIARLEHEYSLRDELDSDWAVRPRTQESVILDDASVQNLFLDDEYFLRQGPRSVLCLPLVKQAKLMGVA
jgi:GAF domain-containing protein